MSVSWCPVEGGTVQIKAFPLVVLLVQVNEGAGGEQHSRVIPSPRPLQEEKTTILVINKTRKGVFV